MSARGEQTALGTGWPEQKELCYKMVGFLETQTLYGKINIKKSKNISNFVPVPLRPDAGKTHMTALPPGAGESCSHSLC